MSEIDKIEINEENIKLTPNSVDLDWEKKYREEIEEVNLRADMLCAWNDELENKLSKYERVFENFKYSIENAIEELKKEKTSIRALGYKNGREAAYKGVLKLLEELMKGE